MMVVLLLLKMRLKDEDDTADDDADADAKEWVLLISSVNVTVGKIKSLKCCLLVSCKGQ